MKKIAIVTGGSGNIGSNIVERLVKRDVFVYSLDMAFPSRRPKKNFSFVDVDITDEPSVEAFFSSIQKVDILINNAGIGVFTPFEHRTLAEFINVVNVNQVGTFLMCREAVKLMKKNTGGRIVNMGSIYGEVSSDPRIYGESGRNNSEVYSMTKAAIIHLTKYLTAHYAASNIIANTISPGGIYAGQSEDFVANYVDKTPSGRMAAVDDIGSLAEYLSLDSSNHLNGQNITVDGGFCAW